MIKCLDFLRGIDTLSLIVKLALALILGGAIGIERELKHRPAGFRTHILICLGAAITTITSIYLYSSLKMFTDISRLGASVISGMGFVGAGAIIVTKNRKVKGLTTAAGFWVAAIIGLAVGAGYYEGAISAALLVVFSEIILSKIEYRMLNSKRNASITVSYNNAENLTNIISFFRENGINVIDIEISKNKSEKSEGILSASFYLQLRKNTNINLIITELKNMSGVTEVNDDQFNDLKE